MDWGWSVGGYVALWWMVLFTLLPWGWRAGKPGLLVKAAVATVGAAVLWGVIFAISLSGIITFAQP
jgi:hypothetical protein